MANKYIVFSVDGGDRLTLLLPPTGGAPEFKQVLLSYVQCPKPARRQGTEMVPDEPCGYDAMDFTRALVIGKEVSFVGDFSVEALQRTAGRLAIKDGGDLGAALLKAGLATVNERAPKVDRATLDRYVDLQNQAKAAKAGVWAANAKQRVRALKPAPPTDAEELSKRLHGTEEKVRVERVQSGHMLLVTLLSGWQQLQLNMTGIQCNPAMRKDGGGVDPIGAEAKFHTERMLLHRHIMIRFEGTDSFGNFYGSVVSPKGTFQEQLVAKGLAKLNQATLVHCAAKDALRSAEGKAMDARQGMWKDVAASSATGAGGARGGGPAVVTAGSAPDAGTAAEQQQQGQTAEANREYSGQRDFEGVVTQIINGDTIVVRNLESHEQVKLSLCGIRGCKTVRREQDAGKAHEVRVSYEEYSWEAKEFLRTKFLGMKVAVHVEYGRHFDDTKEVRAVATVVDDVSGVNVGVALLAQGLGKFFLGRNDTCSCADELQQAEAQARARGVGIHSSQEPPVTKVVELNRLGENKARYYLSFLQRGMQGNRPPVWKGIADVVLSSSSFRVYVPREHFQFTLKLAGIITPSSGFNGEQPDPYADESKAFAIEQVQQREVEVQVDSCDRGGNFIGNLSVKGKNFAVTLVEHGLATVANADRLSYHGALVTAEKQARAAKKNIWASEAALPQRHLKREAEMLRMRPDSFALCSGSENQWGALTIADVVDATTVSVQLVSPENAAAKQRIQATVGRAVEASAGGASDSYEPKRGDVVAAYYKDDKTWYRGKVTNVTRGDARAEVFFTDFGTRAEVRFKEVRPVPRTAEFAVIRDAAPLATQVKLSFLRNVPPGNEFADAACDEIWAFVEENAALVGRCDYVDGHGHKYYAIAGTPGGPTLTERLLRAGLAVTSKAALALNRDAEARYMPAQLEAKRAHRCMWQYGDVPDEDEEA